METRSTTATLELREEKEDLIIEGYFTVFDDVIELYQGSFEKMDRGAFSESLSGDVRALINHDHTLVLGRTASNTLSLETDEKGLYGRIKINPNDSEAMNLYERVKRGDVSQCSIGFMIEKESYAKDDQERVIWTIEKAKLYEVSVCTFPAYENTRVEARKHLLETEIENEKIRLRKRLDDVKSIKT